MVADIHLVFAHLKHKDFTAAADAIDSLSIARATWKSLLERILSFEQSAEGVFSLQTNTSAAQFFLSHADSVNVEGQSIAQSIVKEALNELHELPVAHAEVSGERITGLGTSAGREVPFVFPNPVTEEFILGGAEKRIYSMKVHNLVGQGMLEEQVASGQKISLAGFAAGAYLVSFTDLSSGKKSYYTIIKNE